jgi:fructose-1,6-bisphosphatase I
MDTCHHDTKKIPYILMKITHPTLLLQGDNAFAAGDYVAVFDPIDGSKNIDSSLPVGTVFGIYKCTPGTSPTDDTFLQKGDEMVAAGYCLYS